MFARPESRQSRASSRSRGQYRVVAPHAVVDDSLFGGATNTKRGVLGESGRSALNGTRTNRRGAKPAQGPVVVHASEISALKNRATIQTPEDLAMERAYQQERRENKQRHAIARKNRMIALEQARKKAIPPTKLEREEAEFRKRVQENAAYERDEDIDEVKQMNSIQEYAKMAMVRKKQIEQKKKAEQVRKDQERMKDLEAEIIRLEELKRLQDRERDLRLRHAKAREQVEVQMKERAKIREESRKQLQKEGEEAVAKMRQLEVEERENAQKLAERKAVLRAEVLRENELAIQSKKDAKQREIEEERRLFEYQQEMARKAAEEEAERERQKALREYEFAKMRAQQKKHVDNRSAIDELRAKRAFEQGQRRERQKEMEAARRKKQQAEEIQRSRQQQLEEKEMLMALEIQREKEEYENNMRVRNEWIRKEREAQEQVHEKNLRHRDEIQRDAEQRRQAKKQEFIQRQAEARQAKEAESARLARLEQIKQRKIQELQEIGVDNTYLAQLHRVDPKKALRDDYKLGAQGIRNRKT